MAAMSSGRIAVKCAVLLLSTGCPEPDQPSPSAGAARTATASASALPSSSAAPAPSTRVFAPPTSIPGGPTHLAGTTPPAANDACKPRPKTAAGPIAQLAKVVRRLSCEPALYFMTGDALRTELALPADHTVELGGPSSVTIRFPEGTRLELAAAIASSRPFRRDRSTVRGAGGLDLRTTKNLERLEHFSPNRRDQPGSDNSDIDDKVESIPLGETMLDGYLRDDAGSGAAVEKTTMWQSRCARRYRKDHGRTSSSSKRARRRRHLRRLANERFRFAAAARTTTRASTWDCADPRPGRPRESKRSV